MNIFLKGTLALLLTAFLCFSYFSFAKSKVSSEDDVCKIYLCMAGKALGKSGGKECKAAEKAFFKLVKFKKGKFSPSATFNLRKRLLGGCTSADPKYVKKILSSFGRILKK